MSNPIDDPELWHTATIAGRDTPGLATVTGAKRPRKWDEKEGPGASGASLTYRGDRLVAPTLTLKLWEPEHFDEWEDLHAYLKPLVKGKAVDFFHPSVEDLDVRSVVIEEIGQREMIEGSGGAATVAITLKEFRPPPKANATGSPNGSKNGSGKGGGTTTAQSEQEKEIARLLEEAKKP